MSDLCGGGITTPLFSTLEALYQAETRKKACTCQKELIMIVMWSNRTWDMFIDVNYAEHKDRVDKSQGKDPEWVYYASKRHWTKSEKWYGY